MPPYCFFAHQVAGAALDAGAPFLPVATAKAGAAAALRNTYGNSIFVTVGRNGAMLTAL